MFDEELGEFCGRHYISDNEAGQELASEVHVSPLKKRIRVGEHGEMCSSNLHV